MKVHFTGVDEVDDLGDDLARAARVMPDEARKVTQVSAGRIKRGWQKRWSGHPKIRMLPGVVTYDTEQTLSKVSAEIGPDHDRPGAPLANIIEYEFGGIHSAPIPGGAPALEAERPLYERALADLEVRLLEHRR